MVVEKDYESPQVDLAKSRCSTPRNAPTVNDITDKDRPIADLMDIVTSKFNEVLDAQENHMRKVMKENAVSRKQLLEVLGDGDKPESLKSLRKKIKANRDDNEPLMFNGKDLISFKTTDEGP